MCSGHGTLGRANVQTKIGTCGWSPFPNLFKTRKKKYNGIIFQQLRQIQHLLIEHLISFSFIVINLLTVN